MIEISAIYSLSSILALLFEGLYVVFGIIVLALIGAAAPGRKGLIATSGALLLLGALGDVAVYAWGLYSSYYGVPYVVVPPVLHFVFTLMFVAGLLTLVLAATRRPEEGPAAAPPPPHAGPSPSPAR